MNGSTDHSMFCNGEENSLTLTLSPQGRGEGTGSVHRANDTASRSPSSDANEERFGERTLVAMASCLILGLAAIAYGDSPPSETERSAHLERMKQIAERFHVQVPRDGKHVSGKMVEKPLLRYNDSTRRLSDSTLWLWTERELPCGLMAIEFYPKNPSGPQWLFEFVSLSDANLAIDRGNDWKWGAKQSGLEWRPISNATEPSAKPTLRLTQAKQLFQRFAAHENEGVNGHIELRPLANPLYRYSDEASGVIDGVIFAFVNGTNPEVLLVIEARHDGGAKVPSWCYSLAQMTGAKVSASIDDQEVWTQGEADPPAVRSSYVNGWLPDAIEKK